MGALSLEVERPVHVGERARPAPSAAAGEEVSSS